MGLSNDLISQFAKATNDNTKKPSESTHFGTIVEYDGGYYVKLDGTEQLTPVMSTATLAPGERVTVLLKDHSATVTGNITSPSATHKEVEVLDGRVSKFGTVLADKVDTKYLIAEVARIDHLYADNATITGKLTSQEAEIKSLTADNAVITGKLEANDAVIKTLTANNATITGRLDAAEIVVQTLTADNAVINGKLEANDAAIKTLQTDKLSALEADIKYATIANLNAAIADIGLLNADVADINTLMFGSASGNSIHSSFSNAIVAQISNAQIKSAMIESVAAGKITAGDIITNNVRVLSNDGNLLISDETISISDDSRVRVQIGKDAIGDYSINVWDADGNLMFSEGGITDKAIKDSIIRDNMVAGDANISGSKLNIQSLYSAMNEDGSSTLNAAKIYLDDKSQTLDIAFTSVSSLATNTKNDLDNLTATVTSQGTQLSAVQGQIASRIWTEDITTAVGNISVGARNLAEQTSSEWTNTNVTQWFGSVNYYINGTLRTGKLTSFEEIGLHVGDDFTMSIDLNAINKRICLRVDLYREDTIGTNYAGRYSNPVEIGQNGKAVYTNKVSSEFPYFAVYIGNVDSTDAITTTEQYKCFKIEKGNVATDWTPSPKDYDSAITTINTQYSNLVQELSGVTAIIGEHTTQIANKADGSLVTEISNRVTDITANLEGFKTTVSNTYTTKTEFENLDIGGRNLLLDSATKQPASYNGTVITFETVTVDEWRATDATRAYGTRGTTTLFAYMTGLSGSANISQKDKIYTLSIYVKNNHSTSPLYVSGNLGGMTAVAPGESKRVTFTVTGTGTANVQFNFTTESDVTDFDFIYWHPKIEFGNKPTDWSPAPEDMATAVEMSSASTQITQLANKIGTNVSETNPLGTRMSTVEQTASDLTVNLTNTQIEFAQDISEARKTATDYLNFSSVGLTIGDMTVAALGRNVLIHPDGIDLRNGESIKASFRDSLIELGRHSKSAKIDLCKGTATLYNEASNNPDLTYNKLVIDADDAIYQTTQWEIWNKAFYDENGTKSLASISALTGTPWSDTSFTVSPKITMTTAKDSTGKLTSLYMSDDYIELSAVNCGANSLDIIEDGAAVLYFDDDVQSKCDIRMDATAKRMYLSATDRIVMESPVYCQDVLCVPNGGGLHGKDTGNNNRHIIGLSSNDNVIVGYGVWNAGIGNTHLYGNSIYHYVKSAGTYYKPYWEPGDTMQLRITTAGYVTSSKTTVYFTIPISKPIIGATTITVTSRDGLRLRQNDKYTHGSSSDTWVIPDKYTAAVSTNHIRLYATLSDVTNAINNDVIGIDASVIVTIS